MRRIFAELSVDEEVMREFDDDNTPIEYVEWETGKLNPTGIFLEQAMIADADDTGSFCRYRYYLIDWAFNHDEYENESPMCFLEWKMKGEIS